MGPLWDNYEGSVPKEPYQPEFVILTIRKYKNDTITMESAEIHSDNVEYPSNSPVANLREFWFICNQNSDFMLATIDQAYRICKGMNSTIKTYYSKNDMLKFMTRVILNAYDLYRGGTKGANFRGQFESKITPLKTDQRVVQNKSEDFVFKFSHTSNPYLSRLVWTGTKRSNFTELTDEYGEKFTLQEFLSKLGVNRYVHGDFFPSSVQLTRDFKLRTSTTNECICLCKTIDVPFWKG